MSSSRINRFFHSAFLSCCALFIHFTTIAQKTYSSKLRFEHLGTDQGFPQSAITDIKQDKTGFIWIATRDGVYRYDGYSFRSFSHPVDDKSFYKSQETNNLNVCSDSTVWIAATNGLYYFDASQEKIIKVRFSFNEDYSYIDEGVLSICEDHKGNLWFVTTQGELFTMNLKTGEPKLFYKDGGIQNVFFDHNENIWLGTGTRGLYHLNPITKQVETFQHDSINISSISGNNVKQIMEDSKGLLWVATWSGLNRFDPATKKFTQYIFKKDDPASIGFNTLNSVLEDHNGTIWAASYLGGLSKYNWQTDNFTIYRTDPADPMSLGGNHVTALCEDRSGVLWVGTNGGGLNKASLNKKKFTVYKDFDPLPHTHYIISLYTSGDGKIWMGTFGGGFYCFDPLTKQFTGWHWDEFDMVKGTFDWVQGFGESPDGTIWIVTSMEGLLSLNRKTAKVTVHYSLANEKGLAKIYGQFTSICTDESDKIWLGAYSGLKIYDPARNVLSNYKQVYKDTHNLSSEFITAMIMDENGILWIGGDNGLIRLDTKTGKVKTYNPHKNDPDSVSQDAINRMVIDKHGYMWLAYEGGGLVVFDREKEIFRTFSTADGLPSNAIKGVLVDKANNLWICTGNGICECSYDQNESPFKAKLEVRNYDIANGPGSNDFGYAAGSTKDNDGTFYFGSLNGLVAFQPDSTADNEYKPPIVLTEFLLKNKNVNPADSGFLKHSITVEKEIKLSYKENVIGFTFAALNYDHPEKNKYAYELENYDKDWINTDATRRYANYTNLDPGTYVFKVKATNNDGLWNETPTELKIIITPPFWQTVWFRILLVVVVIGLLYAFYRYRIGQILLLQRIRNKIAADLHDDIGSTLNSISVFSEVARKDSSKRDHALRMIGEGSRKTIDSMSDIVWSINPANDSFDKIIFRMRSLSYNLLKAKKIECTFSTDDSLSEIKLPMEIRRNFYLIFKEALNNLVKYSLAAHASILISREHGSITCVVRDDGVGFDSTQEYDGNGLGNMKKRAKEIGAVLLIDSTIGKGTSIELNLKT